MTLRKRRFRRGSLELAMPELEIDLDKDGKVSGAHLAQNTESHQIIEEFMLAANEAVAEKLRDAELLFLRRVHGAPDPRKLKALTAFVNELGFKTESLENRFALQKLLDDVKGDPREHAVNYAVLAVDAAGRLQPRGRRPLRPGERLLLPFHLADSPLSRPHGAPPHRDPGVGQETGAALEALLILGDHCSDREQRAAEAERELNKVKLLNYLADKVGMQLNGVVTGVESFGLFVTGCCQPRTSPRRSTDDYDRQRLPSFSATLGLTRVRARQTTTF